MPWKTTVLLTSLPTATALPFDASSRHCALSGRSATDAFDTSMESSRRSSPAPACVIAPWRPRRKRSLTRRGLGGTGGVPTASAGAPLPATCLRRLGEGDSSDDCVPAVGESAANSRSTGPPVVGDWKNDTLRMDRVLRRVDTVAVE